MLADQGSGDHAGLNATMVSALTPDPDACRKVRRCGERGIGRQSACATSRSSWTAMAAGPPHAACRAPKGIGAASRRVRRTVEAALELGIDYLTLFSFSSENWSRPTEEMERPVRARSASSSAAISPTCTGTACASRVIGSATGSRRHRRDARRRRAPDRRQRRAATTVAFNYGARDEIARAGAPHREAMAKGDPVALKKLPARSVNISTPPNSGPRSLIRTSGELRR